MKKTYIAPAITREVALKVHTMLCASGVTSDENGIGYGGVDTGGTMDPSAREGDFWDDEADDENSHGWN